jgi:hypothetical protein
MPRDLLTDLGLDIFASPDTKRYYLGQSRFFVSLKNELDYGERKLLDGAAIRGYERQMAEQGRDLDTSSNTLTFITQLDRVAPLRLAVWIVDWFIVTKRPDGSTGELELPERLEDRVGLFRRMRESFAQQLVDILDKHEEEVRKERQAADVAAGLIDQKPPIEDEDPNPSSGSIIHHGQPANEPPMLSSASEPDGHFEN